VSSSQGKKKARVESNAQGISHTQEKLAIVMPKILVGVKENDDMVGGVGTKK
jgi:hypothetical protein